MNMSYTQLQIELPRLNEIYSEFYGVCCKGHLEKARQILSNNPYLYIYNLEYVFNDVCGNGHLELAKWLLNMKPNIDLSAIVNNISIQITEEAFNKACCNGHLEVLQWLLTVNSNINISSFNDYAFDSACHYGHLEVAQWLLTVKPNINISALGEYAFRTACKKGQLKMALWLQSLKPYLYVIKNITDKEIDYYIRTKEEAKWEKIKNGLWLQSVNSNIIGALPIDISKTVLVYC